MDRVRRPLLRSLPSRRAQPTQPLLLMILPLSRLQLFVQEQLGQYVIVRATGEQIFEEMPLYVRIGMHLLFVSGVRLLAHESVDALLVRESERQGRVYDQEGPEVRRCVFPTPDAD
jgi:hypothetical protein